MKKRRHHYVWRKYLRAWANEEIIWCSRNGNVFQSNLMGVSQQRDFYKLKHLSRNDLKFIRSLTRVQHKGVLKKYNDFWIDTLNSITTIHNALESGEIQNEALAIYFDELVYNTEENYHESIESSAITYIESILNKNCDFFDLEESRSEFSHYLCFQYIRTKRIKENICNAYKHDQEKFGIDIENVWSVMRCIMASAMAFSIISDKNYRISLLLNDTNIPLITGDQPVVNIQAYGHFGTEIPEKTEFYYPVSPSIAILVSKNDFSKEGYYRKLSGEDVCFFNDAIIDASYEQIYSNKNIFQ